MSTKVKVDKGFCISYWNLSYRRKFIRTAWTTLLCLPLLYYIFEDDWLMFGLNKNTLIITYLLISLIQLVYNYVQWQSEKNKVETSQI